MTNALTRVGLGDVFTFPLKVVFGAIGGTAAGLTEKAAVKALEKDGFYAATRNFVSQKVIGPGFSDLALSKVGEAYADIGKVGLKEGFQGFMKALAATRLRGWLLLGAIGLGSMFVISSGWNTVRHAQGILGDLSRGTAIDLVRNPEIHMGRLLSGIGMVGGGILCLFPGGAAVGIPLAALSTCSTLAFNGVRSLIGGVHPGNYSEVAPWPLNLLFRSFNQLRV